MKLELNTSLPIQFEKQEDLVDSRFTKVKVWLMHTGRNLNNSIFSKEVVETALSTLSNIPIVGYIQVDKNNDSDFAGHEERIVVDKDGISVEYLGRVYGVIPETHNAQFEIKTVDGVEREFLTCEGLLYNKFPESINIFERDGFKSQSMELQPGTIEGKFNKQGIYEFSKFKFEAACILGEGVTPAMSGSLVEKFSVSSMQSQLSDVLVEFNKYYSTLKTDVVDKGGDTMDEKLNLLENYSQLGEEVIEKVKVDLEKYSFEKLEVVLTQMSEAEPRSEEESPIQDEKTEEELVVEPETQEEVTEEEESTELEFDYKAEYEKIKSELDSVSENFSKLEEELTSLREFKLEKDREEKLNTINNFSELSEDVLSPFKEELDKYTKEEIELHLLAEVGKRNLSFSKTNSSKDENIKSLTNFEVSTSTAPAWHGLVEQYKNKN